MPFLQSVHKKAYDAITKSQKGSDEGKIYEKLSLALLAKRGYELSVDDNSEVYNFTIGREVGIGREKKFDDVVFKYIDKDNINNLIFVQIKHKQDDYQIDSPVLSTSSRLKGGKDGNLRRDFNLQKYFISFLNVREELRKYVSGELVNGKLKYVVIFTNTGLNTEELNDSGFSLKKAPYDITNLFSLTKLLPKKDDSNHCYQFGNVSEGLHKIFKESSDLHRLAKKLAQYVVCEEYREKNILKAEKFPMKYYHVALRSEVIEKSDQVQNKSPEKQNMKTKQYCEAWFRDDFLNNDKPGSKQELRDALFQAIRELDESKKSMADDELKGIAKDVKWKIVPNFGKTKQNNKVSLPYKWTYIKDKDITDFLKCLVFVVNQPKVEELEKILSQLTKDTVVEGTSLGQVLDKIQNAGPEFKKRIEKLLGIDQKTKCEEKWISGEKILDFIDEQKKLINVSFIVSAMTLIYESEVMQYGKFIQCEKLIKSLNNFLFSDSQILCINTSVPLLSSIKVLQCLNAKNDYTAEKGRISICIDIINNKGNKDSVLKVFELESNNLLTIECRHTVNELDVEEFYYKLSNIIKSNSNKKILIIEQYKSTILAEKFRTDFQDKRLYVAENDSIDLKDFEPKEDPFGKHVLVFQGQEERVSLASLTGIDNWSSYVNNLTKENFQNHEAIIDTETLFKILNSDKIEIGNKPLGTSSLDGAYATVYEEVNAETLARTLLSQNLDNNAEDIYIISGINGLNQEEKSYKFIQYLKLANEQENIKNQLDNIGSDCKIQIVDDDFKDKNFQGICHDYPEKQIFWIYVKHKEDEIKFILQQFYNPNFYLKRKFKSILIKKRVKEQLINEHLCEIFLFYCVKNQNELIDYLKFTNKCEKEKFENNCKNGNIQILTLGDDVEASFQEICKQNKNKNVHWLKLEEDQLIWCQSHGSLQLIQDYIDHKLNKTSLVEEDNLIKEIKYRKVVLIADDPGMGKTSSLTRLYETNDDMSKSFIETHWVIRINLKDHIQAIRTMELKNKDFGILNVVSFLSKVDLKLNHSLSKNLLQIALNKDKYFSKPLLLAFDGFDEVLEADDRRKTMSLLDFLNNKTAAKLWVTTRLHFQQTLEHELSTFAIEFDPLNEKAKVTYVTKYLKDRLCLLLSRGKFTELFNNEEQENKRIEKYVGVFLNKMKSVFKSNACRFIGTPLQLYLMLEGSLGHLKNWIENGDQNPDFNYLGNDVLEVYKKFIDRKYDIYFKKLDIRGYMQQKQNKFFLNQCNKDFAKSLILNSEQKKTLTKFKTIILSAGIIKAQDSNIEFIHATFRDYFASKVFIHWIKKFTNDLSNTTKQEYLLKDILKMPDYQVIRTFIDIKLQKMSQLKLSGESAKQYGEIIENMLEGKTSLVGGETVLHLAVKEGNSNIVYFLLNSLKENRDILKKLLFSPDKYKKSALHLACELDEIEIVRILLNAAAGISEDTLQEFIYLCNKNQSNALDEAVLRSSNIGILKELLKRANSKLDLIVNEKKKYSSLCLACEYGKEEYVKALLQEFEYDGNLVKYLLLYKDRYGNSLYWADYQNIIVEYLLSTAKAIKDNNETLKKLLVPDEGHLPFNYAVCCDYNIDVVEKLLNAAKDINDDYHTLKKMLLNEVTRESALLDAAASGCCNIIKLLLEKAASLGTEMLEKLIFAIDWDGKNAIHLMVEFGHEEIFNDSFDILKDDKYHNIQKKVLDIFDSIPLSDRLNDAKIHLISSNKPNWVSNAGNISESTKKSDTSSKDKLRILLLADDGADCYYDTLCILCSFDHSNETCVYEIIINDEEAPLKELITRPRVGNRTPFEAVKKGYKVIREIIESLILEARNNNDEYDVNILQELNSAQVTISNECSTNLHEFSEESDKSFTNFKIIMIRKIKRNIFFNG